MSRPDPKRLPEDRRKEIFAALVETQDEDPDVARSRSTVSRKFDVTIDELRQIEREGIDSAWPPL